LPASIAPDTAVRYRLPMRDVTGAFAFVFPLLSSLAVMLFLDQH